MFYILIPVLVVLVVGLLAIDVKIGFIVAEATENTGFSFGFYIITVLGLIACQISFVMWFSTFIN